MNSSRHFSSSAARNNAASSEWKFREHSRADARAIKRARGRVPAAAATGHSHGPRYYSPRKTYAKQLRQLLGLSPPPSLSLSRSLSLALSLSLFLFPSPFASPFSAVENYNYVRSISRAVPVHCRRNSDWFLLQLYI